MAHTATVKILINPSMAVLNLVLPALNWTLPSGFLECPLKYLQIAWIYKFHQWNIAFHTEKQQEQRLKLPGQKDNQNNYSYRKSNKANKRCDPIQPYLF